MTELNSEPTGNGTAPAPQPQKKKKHTRTIICAVVAVIVLAGAGMLVWHEQPSFCGTVCHTPMSTYVTAYESAPNAPTHDAYGNEVSNSNALLTTAHRAAGLTCLSCHEPTLEQQVGEGTSWLTGNYEYPLAERSLEDLTSAVGNDNQDSFCLKSGCHDAIGITDRESLKESTAGMQLNPHDTRHGDLPCSSCHKALEASTIICSECHDQAKLELPDGWVTYGESRAQLPELQNAQ